VEWAEKGSTAFVLEMQCWRCSYIRYSFWSCLINSLFMMFCRITYLKGKLILFLLLKILFKVIFAPYFSYKSLSDFPR